MLDEKIFYVFGPGALDSSQKSIETGEPERIYGFARRVEKASLAFSLVARSFSFQKFKAKGFSSHILFTVIGLFRAATWRRFHFVKLSKRELNLASSAV